MNANSLSEFVLKPGEEGRWGWGVVGGGVRGEREEGDNLNSPGNKIQADIGRHAGVFGASHPEMCETALKQKGGAAVKSK